MYLCKHCNFQTMHKELMTRHTDTAQHSPKEPMILTLPEKLVELDRVIRSPEFHKFYSEHLIDGPAVQCDGVYHYSPTPMACGHEGSPCPLKYTAEYQKTLMQLFEKFL